ncbi:MAG: helix-turn-helix transcriptional regulator, partial [Pseudomonadota bacterium]
HEPSRAEQVWSEQTGSDCTFRADANAIVLPIGALDCPMRSGGHETSKPCSGALDRALALRNLSQPTVERVASVVYALLGQQAVDQDAVARALGLSRRSLRRKLESEGRTFSQVLTECRFRLAKHALSRTNRSLAQIALDLGYSEQSAFTRAFSRRAGLAPGQYRERHASPRPAAMAPRPPREAVRGTMSPPTAV